ncbi:MAG: carbohydrate porin [Bacteroidota bacterium]|nr:carbohydrate porin [Bacteroidota bacterium]
MKLNFKILTVALLFGLSAFAQKDNVVSRLIGNDRLGKKDSVANWTIHGQITSIFQYHPSFQAPYSGTRSMNSSAESALSLTSTIFLGRKLWKGAVIYFNPELSGGQGLSKTTGAAGFPNGEIYRVGNPTPTPFIARGYIQQNIALGHSDYDLQPSDQNQLAGKIPSSRVTISVGRFCLSDFFDDNSYSHDARSQFMNWSLMAAGAWDFPADVRGYTGGIVIEFIKPLWALRFSAVQVPLLANSLKLDWHLNKANSETLEFERRWKIKGLTGVVRGTGYISYSKAPYYKDATKAILTGDTATANSLGSVINGLAESNSYGGIKYGFGINAEQDLGTGFGVFTRGNWNDGHSATWAFTEIDHNVQLGLNMKGSLWLRPTDNFGLAGVINGISKQHRDYLRAGGTGFIVGDGALNYGNEFIIETYYRAQLASFLAVSLDYQFIANPGYNKDRGPVHVLGLRVHLEI